MSSSSSFDNLPSSNLHLLPCSIIYNGDAPINNYFISKDINENDNNYKQAHFRGRELFGNDINLPDDYIGIIGYKKDDKKIQELSKFNKFTYWNREIKPSTRDIPKSWIKWIDISKSIHETSNNKKESCE